ncbi:MAG: GNAT family N-acetyltransferase [Pseudomonadota bacterium]
MTDTLDVTVRLARAGDLSRLDALFGRTYPKLLKADYPPSVMVTAVPLIAKAQPALVSSGTFRVAELSNGDIIGAGGWTPRRKRPQIGDVRHVVCDDRFLRNGIARSILQASMKEAAADGVRIMDCKSTRTAVPFYLSMGFVPLGPIDVPLRDGITFPAIQMQLRL